MSKSKAIEPSIMESSGIPFNLIRFWNTLQRNYSAEGLTVIEFTPTVEEGIHWRIYLGQEDKKRGFLPWNRKDVEVESKINQQIKTCFRDPDFKTSKAFWKQFEQDLNWRGCFMPVNEILNLGKSQLAFNLTVLKLKQKYFPFTSFLSAIKEASQRPDEFKVPLPILSIWHYFRHYVDFLKDLSTFEKDDFNDFKELFKEHFIIAGFDEELPSQQLVDILFMSLEQYHLDEGKSNEANFNKLLEKALPPVRTFFEKYKSALDELIERGCGASDNRTPSDSELEMRNAFYEICTGEVSMFEIQEILEDRFGHDLVASFSTELQNKYGKNRKQSLGDRLKSVIGDASIMERIQAVTDKIQTKKQPAFAPLFIPFVNEKSQQWHELDNDEQLEISKGIQQFLSKEQFIYLQGVVKFQRDQHYQNILNNLTAPFFIWEQNDALLIPQLNTLKPPRAKKIKESFWQKREAELEELKELDRRLLELYKLNHHAALDKYLNGFNGFAHGAARDKWEQALGKHRMTIDNKANYRFRRMQEFGILGGDEKSDTNKEIYLDEMLKIEQEVKPYILFVKKAFQSALPIRKSVEFDPYRHSHDGVEFDPETIQDQDKWVRANVMKTLRTKVDKGEVSQVNAFCLDSSGSMDHERMRNLFKILYLLILGLEDRKSFDAIHFFNYYFEETVNFSDDYTNRSLLFRVLKRIAILTKEGVVYGGHGGTNISDGVLKCHDQIQEFVKNLKDKKPNANVVTSLFVITDGEPSMGIINVDELGEFVESKRKEGDVAIKGIYIKPEDDESDFMGDIFGKDNFVENTSFKEAVNDFVSIMTATYKEQRKAFKWKMKIEKSKSK